MKRDLESLREGPHDLLVIGGGIYGAAIARAAALRNIKVALIERGDFGGATSANSLKIIHGGLRYLQQMDIRRMRESIRARRRMLTLAPHLVTPQSFVIPTYGHALKGREVMTVALGLNDLISWDRNREIDASKHIPGGRTYSRQESLQMMPGIDADGLTGAAQWHDCVAHNTERLTLAFVQAAAEQGACVANYVAAEEFHLHGDTVKEVECTDRLTGETFRAGARLVVDATGPWASSLADSLPRSTSPAETVAWARAANLVIKRRWFGEHAVGLASRAGYSDQDAVIDKGDRYFFFVPWREGTLIGTSYEHYSGRPENCRLEKRDVVELIDDINRFYPAAELSMDDVSFWHAGLLPCSPPGRNTNPSIHLLKQHQILDGRKAYGIEGLISVRGVKYTSGANVADEVVAMALARLDRAEDTTRFDPPLPGGERVLGSEDLESIPEASGTLAHLQRQYGTRYLEVLKHAGGDPDLLAPISERDHTIGAEILYAVRNEMAQNLEDVVLRRTELGTLAYPGDSEIERCARIMSKEIGWDSRTTSTEIDAVARRYDLEPGPSVD